MKTISLIIPVFNEEDCLPELMTRLTKVFNEETSYEFECVLIENGSTDSSFEIMSEKVLVDSRFKVVRLSRNFQMDGGLTAGLDFVTGDACVLMTADLQDPPEVIPQFIRLWEQGFDNVYGKVESRAGISAIRKINSQMFYRVASILTGGLVVRNASDFRLVDQKVYKSVREMKERNRFVRGLFSWVGFSSIAVPIDRPPRYGGTSKAFFKDVFNLATKGIFAHSYFPLRFISIFAIAVSVLSFLYLVGLAISIVFQGVPFSGFGTLIGTILLGLSITTAVLAVIAEYIALIYEEVKQRPNFVVESTLGIDDSPVSSQDVRRK